MIRFFILAVLIVVGGPAARAVTIEKVTSPGGITAWLIEDHTNPIIAVDVVFRGGAALDPAGREGLADFVSATLDEGAGDLDSQAFQQALADHSISLSFDAGRESFGGELKTLSVHQDRAFDLLRLALTQPRFEAEAVERMRDALSASLRRDLSDANDVALRRLLAQAFPGHPYGRPRAGTLATVAAITAADLAGFAERRLARNNLIVSVVGDMTPKAVATMLDRVFATLPATASPWTVPETTARLQAGVDVTDMDLQQSTIILAQPGIKRHHPDFYAAYVLNYILGGGSFASRLYGEVREKRGLAYSVYSQLYPLQHSAVILAGAGTANARVGDTVAVIRDQWRDLAAAGVTAEELADAKTYLTGSYALRFSSSSAIAGMLSGIQFQNFGPDYIENRNGYIDAVSLDQANRVARDLYDPDKLAVFVVGRPEGLAATQP